MTTYADDYNPNEGHERAALIRTADVIEVRSNDGQEPVAAALYVVTAGISKRAFIVAPHTE